MNQQAYFFSLRSIDCLGSIQYDHAIVAVFTGLRSACEYV